ncbi:MAG: AtpZ/AtpI family protein [Bacteroidales bacterium]|nr:AtpZ/AtpI family protein [Bacteroidales bacterium]
MHPDLRTKKNKSSKKHNLSLKNYAKYSGIAFQMAAIIIIGTFGGYKLDQYFGFEKHILTLILSLLSVILAIYTAIKDFLKK